MIGEMPAGPRLWILSLVLLLPAIAAPIPVLTVCEVLRDPGRYHHTTVIVVGALHDADGGSWLNQNCGPALSSISLTWSEHEFAPPPKLPKRFHWDQSLIRQKLDEVKTTTHLQPKEEWLAVFGRLETKPSGSPGFTNRAPARLIAPDNGYLSLKE